MSANPESDQTLFAFCMEIAHKSYKKCENFMFVSCLISNFVKEVLSENLKNKLERKALETIFLKFELFKTLKIWKSDLETIVLLIGEHKQGF